MAFALVCLVVSALFILLLISLGAKPAFVGRITGLMLCFAGVVGILLYGYGFWKICGNLPETIVHTLFSVFCMFLGRNEIGAISAVPPLDRPLAQILLYAAHLLALYCTASAVIASLGAKLTRKISLLLPHRGEVNLIFGVNENTLAFARAMPNNGARTVFAGKDGCGEYESAVLQTGALLLTGEEAAPSEALVRRLGLSGGRHALNLYCLSENSADNLHYALSMRHALESSAFPPQKSALTIFLETEDAGEPLQADEGRYGFGSVYAAARRDLTARLLIRSFPPCRTVRFDKSGCAQEEFEALIIGFGQTGQAVLRAVTMNAQFSEGGFHAYIMAQDPDEQGGALFSRSPGLEDNFDIEFLDMNAHSVEAYRFLAVHAAGLNYVVVCAGNAKDNNEIGEEYLNYLTQAGNTAPVLVCTAESVCRLRADGEKRETVSLFTPELLCSKQLDKLAMQINHRYHAAQGRTPEEDWRSCDYFSRMSCRASADFLPAFLAAAGCSRQELISGEKRLEGELLENLGKLEHMRWCAFHYVMGYRSMPREVYEQRLALFEEEKKRKGSSSIRPGKDREARLHACLVPWEELDALSKKESLVCGKQVDYREQCRESIRIIPELLRSGNEKSEEERL